MSSADKPRRPRRTKAEMERLRAEGLEPPKRERKPKPAAPTPVAPATVTPARANRVASSGRESYEAQKKLHEDVAAATRPILRKVKKLQEQTDPATYNLALERLSQQVRRLRIIDPEESDAKQPRPLSKYQKYIQRYMKLPEMEEYKQTEKMVYANRAWKADPNLFPDLD